jgi:hypothetical protein
MSEENTGESTTRRGIEIDARPYPSRLEDTQALVRPELTEAQRAQLLNELAGVAVGIMASEIEPNRKALESPEPAAKAQRISAFLSRATEVRTFVRPYDWRSVAWSVTALYGAFVGIPAIAGVWAALRIWRETHG